MSDTPVEPLVESPAETLAPVTDLPADVPALAGDDLDRLEGEIDSAYVERLKSESISHRLKAKEYREKYEPWQDVLDGWDEEQAQAVRDLLAAAKAGDTDAITAILGLDSSTPLAEQTPAAAAEAAYLTANDLERILSEREQKAQVEAQVKAIESEAVELGYEKGSNEYALLFKIAHEQTDGDLKAADAKVKAWEQSLVDKFVAGKAGGATPPPAAGGPASGERQIENLDDSKMAALARFNASPVQ